MVGVRVTHSRARDYTLLTLVWSLIVNEASVGEWPTTLSFKRELGGKDKVPYRTVGVRTVDS